MKKSSLLIVALACVVLLASCTFDSHDYFAEDSTQLSRAKFTQIVDALNHHDETALEAIFTKSALADHSTQIDDGVAYLLALFPDGDVATQEKKNIPSAEYKRIDDDHRAILVRTMYRVSSGGKDYWLFFADFTTNTIDRDNVGIYALGVAPRTATSDSDEEEAFFDWTDPFDVDPARPPAIYIPS